MLKILHAHLLRTFIANSKIDAIYALYLESLSDKYLAVRNFFAFSDSVALAPGFNGKIWDLQAKLGLFGTISGLWFLLGESPKFGTSLRALQCRAYLFGGGVKLSLIHI